MEVSQFLLESTVSFPSHHPNMAPFVPQCPSSWVLDAILLWSSNASTAKTIYFDKFLLIEVKFCRIMIINIIFETICNSQAFEFDLSNKRLMQILINENPLPLRVCEFLKLNFLMLIHLWNCRLITKILWLAIQIQIYRLQYIIR